MISDTYEELGLVSYSAVSFRMFGGSRTEWERGMKDGNDVADGDLQNEIARIAELASGMFLQLKEFTRQHGNDVLLGRALRVEAATELACIVSDCKSVSDALKKLPTRLAPAVASRCTLRTPP